MKLKDFFYNLVLYPIFSIFDKYYSYQPKIYKNLNHKKIGAPPIDKGWIITNQKSTSSILFDSYITDSIPLLKFRESLNLLFYSLVLYFSGKLIIVTKYPKDNFVTDLHLKFDVNKILLYYPEDINIFYQIYKYSPSIPMQIAITPDKLSDNLTKITYFSNPILPSDYKTFDHFMSTVIRYWTDTFRQSYISEKRFNESR